MSLGWTDRAQVLWRSLWLQASWSFKGMQTVGFVHALEPAVKGSGEERREKLLRHLDFFNANPFLAPLALGVVASEEEKSSEPNPEAVNSRVLVMGPLGGMGDSLFWGGLKPLASVGAVLLLVEGVRWAAFVMVALFALAGLVTRWYMLGLGLKLGKQAILRLQRLKPILWANRMKTAQAVMLGWVVWRVAEAAAPRIGIPLLYLAPSCVAASLLVAVAARREINPMGIVYTAFAASLAATLLG